MNYPDASIGEFFWLKPDGVFISVTDCLSEIRTIVIRLQSFLSKIKVIPYIRQFKTIELEEIIKTSGFSMIESENLYKIPPNYYLVAKKDEKRRNPPDISGNAEYAA